MMTEPKPPSEFRRGWPIVLSAGIGIGCGASPIPFNTVGHLVIPLQRDFGWGRGEIYAAVTLYGLVVTLLSPWFGSLVDRFGVRRVALGATLGFGLGWGSIAASPASLPVFYALWGVMAVLGGASIPISWTRAIAGWFERQRGLALALALASTGLTAALINVMAPQLIAIGGWRLAVLGTAAMPLVIALPVAYFLFRAPDAQVSATSDPLPVTQGMTLAQALRDRRFWLMSAGLGLVAIAFGGIYANFVPLLIGAKFSPAAAGGFAGTLGLTIVAGRLIAGWLLDRHWAPLVAFPLLASPALGCLLLALGDIGPFEAGLAAILLGLAAGAESDLIAFLAARYFGLAHYGRIYGCLYMSFGLGSAVAPMLVGWSFDVTAGYFAALIAAAVMFVLGASLLLLIGPYPKREAA